MTLNGMKEEARKTTGERKHSWLQQVGEHLLCMGQGGTLNDDDDDDDDGIGSVVAVIIADHHQNQQAPLSYCLFPINNNTSAVAEVPEGP